MKTAILPGSFDPVTNGHLDLIERASRLFDRLIVVVSTNLSKSYLFSRRERVELIRQNVKQLPNVTVKANDGLTANFMRKIHSQIIVRGIRGVNDLDYERSVAFINHHLDPQIETIFLLARPRYECLSSSILKETVHFGGNVAKYLPVNVVQQLQRIRRQNENKA